MMIMTKNCMPQREASKRRHIVITLPVLNFNCSHRVQSTFPILFEIGTPNIRV